ncbi:dephospho-CoA kinase [Mumia flava]|uniref:Dephospho-CoA kinase n=1 Tax=Mumia flava TaxID=1348852 RepID=A0A0B2BD11_9ACTN|nr:dephospho-CoA kinase [Mumia flava]PJJ55958.1 dephospho-CoA kinase [Mumia flava]
MRVGLTGGIGSGKSTVSALLAERGAVVIDSDLLSREVVEPGTEGLAAVVARFGDGVLDADGRLDRPALGAIVFADDAARRDLEAIVHPLVRARAAELERAAGEDAVVVHDVPLLVETGQTDAYDVVVVVDVPTETQVERLVQQRGMAEVDARARITAQATRERRTGAADHVVDNTGSLEELTQSVDSLWETLTS